MSFSALSWIQISLTAGLLFACSRPSPTPPLLISPAPPPDSSTINLDQETIDLINQSPRTAFLIPFSHWDTDWHETFPTYVQRTDGNILAAIHMAQTDPRFRYTFEQVLFVQHFWDTYPEYRADLVTLVRHQQLTFAWAGIIQPETSLTAPAVQIRNLQLGQQWIADTFGPEFIPHTAWQSDAFGNSAAFPLFLAAHDIPYLFIGRWQHRCDPDYQDCTPLPHAFYWNSPLPAGDVSPEAKRSGEGTGVKENSRVLVAYLSYPAAWDNIHKLPTDAEQVAALRAYVETQFARADSQYVFIPLGSDMIDPVANLQTLTGLWNSTYHDIALVVADPDTAFRYLATQPLPEFTVDLNPIWQAFYASRPFAKIADKETEYFLTAADKFGALIHAPPSTAWLTAAVNAHYDNIGAVSFDWVWESTQRPRFEQTLTTAANDLAANLAAITARTDAPLLIFNPASWPRSEVIEIDAPGTGLDPDIFPAPVQILGPDHHFAARADSVPPTGYAAPIANSPILPPTSITANNNFLTLTNGLVSATLDASHGGTFTNLSIAQSPHLLSAYGDDLTYWSDIGDIYGAHFGPVVARESDVPARLTVLAAGPLLARAQAAFTLGGQPVTKTVTLRAGSPLVEIALELKALPETSAVVHSALALSATTRTDDLGFAPFAHEIDNSPIISGDITYRRKIFYPVIAWADVSDSTAGVTLITHGLQGVAGTSNLSLLLTRQVTQDREGVTDSDYHVFRYAYLPHPVGNPVAPDDIVRLAYAFNQPLIPVWKTANTINIQLPFAHDIIRLPISDSSSPISLLPSPFSLLSAQSGLVADLYRANGQTYAVIINYAPTQPVTLALGQRQITAPSGSLITLPLDLPLP